MLDCPGKPSKGKAEPGKCLKTAAPGRGCRFKSAPDPMRKEGAAAPSGCCSPWERAIVLFPPHFGILLSGGGCADESTLFITLFCHVQRKGKQSAYHLNGIPSKPAIAPLWKDFQIAGRAGAYNSVGIWRSATVPYDAIGREGKGRSQGLGGGRRQEAGSRDLGLDSPTDN